MDLYRQLGVDKNASTDKIRLAWLKLAKELHPDRNSSPDATKRFHEAKRASELLLDPARRQEYDLSLAAAIASPSKRPTQKRFGASEGLQDLEAREREAKRRRDGDLSSSSASTAATSTASAADIIDVDSFCPEQVVDPQSLSFEEYESLVLNRILQVFSSSA